MLKPRCMRSICRNMGVTNRNSSPACTSGAYIAPMPTSTRGGTSTLTPTCAPARTDTAASAAKTITFIAISASVTRRNRLRAKNPGVLAPIMRSSCSSSMTGRCPPRSFTLYGMEGSLQSSLPHALASAANPTCTPSCGAAPVHRTFGTSRFDTAGKEATIVFQVLFQHRRNVQPVRAALDT